VLQLHKGLKMRDIRFRAWHKKEKKMFEVSTLDWNVNGLYVDGFGEGNVALMQSTGLKDKQGKELFEGDLIRYEGKVLEVVWEAGRYMGKSKEGGLSSIRYGGGRKLIGNKYENPDLLI